MQIGHVAAALAIASFAPELTGGEMEAMSMESVAVAMISQWLPNLDAVPIWLRIARPSFHCTWSHSVFTAFFLGLIAWFINPSWGIITWVSLAVHFLSDMPSSVGLPLFIPLTRRRFSLNLWADTGFWGWETTKGTYEQAWTWIIEGGAFLVLFIRLYQLGIFPFN